VQLLTRAFGGRFIALTGAEQETLLADLPRLGIAGGAVYDALVAATALKHGLSLRSLDRRAVGTYQAIGVDHTLL